MSYDRTVRLRLSWVESRVQNDGTIEMEIVGHTEGDKAHRVLVKMGPSSIGYIADDLHNAVQRQQETLDEVKRKLRGPT
jgi:hypothetical protein